MLEADDLEVIANVVEGFWEDKSPEDDIDALWSMIALLLATHPQADTWRAAFRALHEEHPDNERMANFLRLLDGISERLAGNDQDEDNLAAGT